MRNVWEFGPWRLPSLEKIWKLALPRTPDTIRLYRRPQYMYVEVLKFFDISSAVELIGVKFCMMEESLSRTWFLPFWWQYLQGSRKVGHSGFWGQFVFSVRSPICVINKIHWCVARRRLLMAGDGWRTRAITYTRPSKCWCQGTVQHW